LFGSDGNDTLYGEGGRDSLFGGPGLDHHYGGAADDRITSAEPIALEAQDQVSCGKGTDRVVADRSDAIAADCENVKYRGSRDTDSPSTYPTLRPSFPPSQRGSKRTLEAA
jgi:hypothetical protein